MTIIYAKSCAYVLNEFHKMDSSDLTLLAPVKEEAEEKITYSKWYLLFNNIHEEVKKFQLEVPEIYLLKDEELTALIRLIAVKKIILRSLTSCSSDKLILILKSLGEKVTSIDLSFNELGRFSAEDLINIIEAVPDNLKRIDLTHNDLFLNKSISAQRELYEKLRKLKNFEKLNITSNGQTADLRFPFPQSSNGRVIGISANSHFRPSRPDNAILAFEMDNPSPF